MCWSPQIQMVWPQSILLSAIRLSQSIFPLLGLPQAPHTENNVQKMSMRLKGRVKLKILASQVRWFSFKQLRKHSLL